MNSVFNFGNPVSLAVVLTVLLIFGIPGGGRLKALGWWPTLLFSMLAGSAYKAAGGPFAIVPDFVGSVIATANGVVPGVTMPALAFSLAIFILFKKLTTKQVGILGIFFWYLAAGAGGSWSYVADSFSNLAANLS
ncbi:hypothetical protein OOK29_25945 [Streptomyces phaeochromogenes]|uniref:hypothetical protein n=1 Tax=Streptomyces phaeochromogenes TaxID=1923 RepID=UPI00224DA224|nr:hypothetical protein [Streptomyces phaeochromogenes]MCX5601597.1 hypothetical protein [Streptomyces phaeochromogenes]